MNCCLVELRQTEKPRKDKTLTHPVFFIRPTIHYELHYLPDNHYINLKSDRSGIFFFSLHGAGDDLRLRRIFTTSFLSRTHIPQSQFDFIFDIFFSKLNLLAPHPRNNIPGYNYIPLSLSVRFIRTREYTGDMKLIWDMILRSEVGRGFSDNLPAMKNSVEVLEKSVYDGGEEEEEGESGSECPICLIGFKVGEKRTRMPCFHHYHEECIVKWLTKSHLCPSCRFPMPIRQVIDGAFELMEMRRKAATSYS